jgi:hypothetical protein
MTASTTDLFYALKVSIYPFNLPGIKAINLVVYRAKSFSGYLKADKQEGKLQVRVTFY